MGTYTQSALSSYVRWGGYVQNAGLSRYWRQSATAWATELYAGNNMFDSGLSSQKYSHHDDRK